ncbi:hypothetical protein [Halomarina litorea]|uniref:hypothetical protein n=1 Tax=Halomarina litorea TaxID=2961595 RepID=UPI0020C4C036|nr:hypothetical protein [Halomarina sp. BCD28]
MSDTGAYQPRIECLLCRAEFERENGLRRHLSADHAREDLVDFVVRTFEEREEHGMLVSEE